jgi:O-methyltransferase
MPDSQILLRREAGKFELQIPPIVRRERGIILGDRSNDPTLFPELSRQYGSLRRFDPARGEEALLLDIADDSLPFVVADNVLQHCPRLSVALTNWIRAVKPGNLIAIAVPENASRSGRWALSLQEPSVPEHQANLLELAQTVCHMATVERISRREAPSGLGIGTVHRPAGAMLDLVLRKRSRTLTPVQSNHSPEAQTLAKVAESAIAARGRSRDLTEFHAILDSGVREATVVDLGRLYLMYQWAQRTLPLTGDFIEVGSYRGGTAKLISELLLRRGIGADIHVFDTFAGMPGDLAPDEMGLKGTFTDTSLRQVQGLLGNNPRAKLHPGLFPQSIPPELGAAQFRFAHIDVDTERSVRDCLEFIYPRMHARGVIIIDDYGHPECPGATRATEQYFSGKPQQIIQMPLVSSAVVLMDG